MYVNSKGREIVPPIKCCSLLALIKTKLICTQCVIKKAACNATLLDDNLSPAQVLLHEDSPLPGTRRTAEDHMVIFREEAGHQNGVMMSEKAWQHDSQRSCLFWKACLTLTDFQINRLQVSF